MSAPAISRRERKKQAARDNIHEETIRLILERGIEAVTVDEICEQSDIARKTFYNYFGSRHDLLMEIAQSQVLQHTLLVIEEAIRSGQPLRDQIRLLFSGFKLGLVGADKLRRELIVYMVSNMSRDPALGLNQLSFMNECFTRLYEHSASELKPGLEAAFCAEVTVGMINSVSLNWLNDNDYDIESRMDTLADFLTDCLIDSSRSK